MSIVITAKTMQALRTKQVALSDVVSPAAGDPATARTQDLLKDYIKKIQAQDRRQTREGNVWLGAAVQFLKDRVSYEEHSIASVDGSQNFDSTVAEEIEQLLDHPNAALANDSFGGLFGMAVEDLLTIDAGVIQKLLLQPLPDQDAHDLIQPYALRALDGAKISQKKDWESDSDGPRYEMDMGRSKPKLPFWNNQLIRMVGSPTTYSDDGISPFVTLQRFLSAELATFRRFHLVQVQATPGGIFLVPGANPGTPDALADEYETNVQGNAGVIFMNLPAESRFVEIGNADLEKQGSFQFYEILVRGIATAFGIPPMVLGWYADVNKGYGSVAEGIAYDGVIRLLKLLRWYINTEIVACWGARAENIRFTFDALEVEDEIEEAASLRTRVGNKDFMTVREARTASGLDAIDERDIPAGAKPFLEELWVPTPLGNSVVSLPWTYFFKFTGIDPATGELPPPPEPAALPAPSPDGSELNGNGSSTNGSKVPALLDGKGNPIGDPTRDPVAAAQAVQKRLQAIRGGLVTKKLDDAREELEELEAINELFTQHFRDFEPDRARDENQERERAGTSQ